MDYGIFEKRSEKQVIKGLNLEIQWVKREIRRASHDVARQAELQFYKHCLRLWARRCHLKLAYLNGTPYERTERTAHKPAPSFEKEAPHIHAWILGPNVEEYSSYAMAS